MSDSNYHIEKDWKMRKIKSISLRKMDICVVLAAVIISMNGIRYLIGIQESNLVIYGVYFLFIAIGTFRYGLNGGVSYPKDIAVILILSIFLLALATITSIFRGVSTVIYAAKLMIAFFTAFVIYLMPAEKYRIILNYFSLIMVVYVVSIMLRPVNIDYYLARGSNYLVLTLPIGLFLTIELTKLIYKVYSNRHDKSILIDIFLTVATFYSLTKFAGRGSILFPFWVAIIFVFILGRKHFFKFWGVAIVLGIALYFAYKFFITFASPYIVSRMQNLFNNNYSEDRWLIWANYIETIKTKKWFLFGGGTGASVEVLGYYPHNIYLQLIGEYGLIGLIESIYVTFIVVKKQVFIFLKRERDTNFQLFIELSAGLMYLFMTFMKSFSLFDASILLIFVFMVISLASQMKEGALNG